jgi:septation ring formation regulator EzrA
MKKSLFRYVALGMIVMIFFVGCAKQPADEINATKSAVDAVVAKGGKYAPAETKKLNNDLTAAMNEVKSQDSKPFKDYSKAKEMLAKVKSDAETIISGLDAKKEQAKQNAYAGQNAAKDAIGEAKDLLAKVPKSKGTAADIETFKANVKGLEDSLQEVSSLTEKEDYIEAQNKAISIEDQAKGFKNQITQALEKIKAGKSTKADKPVKNR